MPSHSVAVIILVYNDPLVKRAVESALAQTYANTSIYVLDNGSTDKETKKIIDSYSNNPRVKVIISPVNLQSECASNFARDAIKEDYISFLFSDDYWPAERISKMIKYANANNCDAVFTNIQMVDERERKVLAPVSHFAGDISTMNKWQHLSYMFNGGNTLHPVAMLVRASTYRENGGFPGYLHLLGDMCFFARLLISDAKIGFMSEKLQYITIHTPKSHRANISNENLSGSAKHAIERIQFLDVYSSTAGISQSNNIFGFKGNDVERLYFLGERALTISAPDYILFGFRCIYEAAARDYDAINTLCMSKYKTSIGEHIKHLKTEYVLNNHGFIQPRPVLFIFQRSAIVRLVRRISPNLIIAAKRIANYLRR